MRHLPSLLALLASIAIAVLIGARVIPSGGNAAAVPVFDNRASFHPGKEPGPPLDGGKCIAAGCHGPSPHKRNPPAAPFRNMHSSHVECLACHAVDSLNRIEARQSPEGNAQLRFRGTAPSAGAKGHPSLGTPPGCRGCHSEAGGRILKGSGLPALPANFADPIAIRMLEGGARSWAP